MIIVFGSLNMDMHMGVNRFPQVGETILSFDYDMSPGGKGGNQALAAARWGVRTAMVGKIGDDGYGVRILNSLRRNEVMTSGIAKSDTLPTGLAMVVTDQGGQNQMIVASGANSELSAEQVPDEILKPGNYVLFQMEVPLIQNIEVMVRAHKRGAKTVLNLAPAIKIPKEALPYIDYLILNELEAGQIAGSMGYNIGRDDVAFAQTMARDGQLTCIVTLGARGAVAMLPEGRGWRIDAMPLTRVVDTAGAGDCFCGTLTALLHEGFTLPEAMKWASVAGGLCCTKKGTQEAYPYRGDVEEHIGSLADARQI
ncbi:MAG: ribokinase [Alphaproteobacteria bacterium]|nr:ribokinase [Alphaproteobacteria bacterium]